MGGQICQDAQRDNCTGDVSSVEMLDMSLGAWQSFAVPLAQVIDYSQVAILDYDLGVFLATNDAVNNALFRRVQPSDYHDDYHNDYNDHDNAGRTTGVHSIRVGRVG